ncbi:MAG: hypothetical protein V4519_04635 [Patescibacteria group bacterium]
MKHQKKGFAPILIVLVIAALIIGGLYLAKIGPFKLDGDSTAAAVYGPVQNSATPAPTNLDVIDGSTSSVPSSSDKICLTWNSVALVNGGFDIERSTDGGATWSVIKRVTYDQYKPKKGYCDTEAHTPDQQKWYRVRAYVMSTFSTYSNVDSAWVSKGTPPRVTSITARVANGGVLVQFTSPSRNETGFEIERTGGTGTKKFTLNATDAVGTIDYNDKEVVAGKTYTYKARVKNSRGFSRYSDPVSVTFTATAVTAPSTPTTPTPSSNLALNWKISHSWLGAPRFELTWTDNNATQVPAKSYLIRRAVSTGPSSEAGRAANEQLLRDMSKTNLTLAKVNHSVKTYKDAKIAKSPSVDTHYHYMIMALDSSGNVIKTSNVIDLLREKK